MSFLLLSFPKGLAVAFLRADHPLDTTNLAATFRQGAHVKAFIARVLASLARLDHGHSESGKTYTLRQVA